MKKRVAYLEGESLKYLALHYSTQNRDFYPEEIHHGPPSSADWRQLHQRYVHGVYEMLNRSHIPLELDKRRQLFLDDFLIAENRGLKRRLHPPDRYGPVMTPNSDAGQIALQSRSSPQWNPEKNLWEWWYWGSWSCEPYGKHGSTSFSLITPYRRMANTGNNRSWVCTNGRAPGTTTS